MVWIFILSVRVSGYIWCEYLHTLEINGVDIYIVYQSLWKYMVWIFTYCGNIWCGYLYTLEIYGVVIYILRVSGNILWGYLHTLTESLKHMFGIFTYSARVF